MFSLVLRSVSKVSIAPLTPEYKHCSYVFVFSMFQTSDSVISYCLCYVFCINLCIVSRMHRHKGQFAGRANPEGESASPGGDASEVIKDWK